MRRGLRHRLGLAAGIAALAAMIGAPGALAQDATLRVAMGSPGEAAIRVWDDVAAHFEAAHPGVDVEMNYQDDDLTRPSACLGCWPVDRRTSTSVDRQPHVQRAADSYAADLTEAVTSGALAGIVDEAVLPAASVDGGRAHAHRGRHQRSGTTCLLAERGVRRRRPGKSCWLPATRSSPGTSSR
jgi:hypothetical protein